MSTTPYGINNAGQIVGYARFVLPDNPRIRDRGFLYADGEFTLLDVPDAFSTVAFGINDSGEIVGVFHTNIGGDTGFLNSGPNFASLQVPGAAATAAAGLDDSGQIVGFFDNVGPEHGFLYSGGGFIPLDAPGARETVARHINDTGLIVGHFADEMNVSHGFLATSTTTVPEPTTLALFGVGVASVVLIVTLRQTW